MSIVTMKRKSRGYNNPISSNGFSLNGGYRNQGWVGQTSISRSINRTVFKGLDPVGHGGLLGSYNRSILSNNQCTSNINTIIKPSTLTTKGYFDYKCSCKKDIVKNNSQNTQNLYIKNLSNNINCCSSI